VHRSAKVRKMHRFALILRILRKTEQRMILKADEERDPDVEIAEEKCYYWIP